MIDLIYRPPNTSVTQFNETFEKLFSLIQHEKYICILKWILQYLFKK